MTNPTSNFGWQMPTSTDLVTDLPADFETFGQAVDTSLADLKGGTSGQILSKASNTDMDFTWVTNDVGDITAVTAGTGISGGGTSGAVTITNSMATAIDAKGDLIGGTGADTFSRLAVGANGTVLTADSAEATGMKWAAAAGGGGGLVFIKRVAFSAVSSTTTSFDSVFTSAYESYLVVCESIGCSSGTTGLQMLARVGGTSQTSLYYGNSFGYNNSNTLITRNTNNGSNFLTLWIEAGGYFGGFALWFESVGNTSEHASWHGTGFSTADTANLSIGGKLASSVNVDGFLLQGGSGTITGAVSVYGLAKS